jgi:hypothetical protein
MTFWSIIAVGRTYTVYFTGTAPQAIRLTQLSAPAGDKSVVRVYFTGALRLQVFVGSSFVEDLNMVKGQFKSQLVREGRWASNAASGSGGYLDQDVSPACACFLGGSCASAVPSSRCDARSDAHGANQFDRATGLLSVLVGGHDPASAIEIRAMPVVQVAPTPPHPHPNPYPESFDPIARVSPHLLIWQPPST